MSDVVFKIKSDKYCKIKLNETFLVDQIYDFKSHKVLHITFVVFDVLDSQHCLRIFEWPSYILVLVHLNWKFKWACLIACCLSVLSHFLIFFFFYRTTWLVSTKRGTNHPLVKRIQVSSNQGSLHFPRGYSELFMNYSDCLFSVNFS